MAKPFRTQQAKEVLDQHLVLQEKLSTLEESVEKNRREVLNASNALVAQEVLKLLRDIPIEEINREKRGFRVKTLHESGYHTMADLSSATVSMLASIRGISWEKALAMKNIANDMTNQVRQGLKIRLSVDEKTPGATALVSSLHDYQKEQPYAEACRQLLHSPEQTKIVDSIQNLLPGTSGVRWFFTGKAKKQLAAEAYHYLGGLLAGEYGRKAQDTIASFQTVQKDGAEEAWKDFAENPIPFFNTLEQVNPGVLGTNDAVYGLPEDLAQEIQGECFFPEGLRCQLRRYQEWGVKYILHQKRVLLGDEMGLGKTIQAIATMVSLRNVGETHFIVVCPASVVTNWCREIQTKSLLRVTKVHGPQRMAALQSWKKVGGVAVTTYETTQYFQFQEEFHYGLLVVDEAHYIKNPNAKRTQNVKQLCQYTHRLLFMTGTPLENKVSEMVELIRILQPDIARTLHSNTLIPSAPSFRKKIAPVYYRRKREDVLTELPELVESKEWCTLLPEEEQIYEDSILAKSFMEARRVSWNVPDLHQSSKARRLLELLEEAKEDGRKVLIFSFFLDTIQRIAELLGSQCLSPIYGAISPIRRQEIIDEFAQAPAGIALIAQIQSGGTGLNIQSASVVVICEPQLKPSIENQAISRAYRMGQTRNVLVYRLLCEDTVDERMTNLLEEKQAIFNAFADKSVAAQESLEIDNKKFGDLIQEEIDRITAKRGEAGRQNFPSQDENEGK